MIGRCDRTGVRLKIFPENIPETIDTGGGVGYCFSYRGGEPPDQKEPDMTAFHVGEFVTSRINEQGLTEGRDYEVVDVIKRDLPFGTFVTYVLEDDNGDRFAVGNGHLVLGRVEVTA